MAERASRQLTPVTRGSSDTEPVDVEMTIRCARPACRQEFKRSTGLGRRRQYCGDTCRGNAEKEYRRAKAVVEQYESLLEQARADVATFGRDVEGDRPSTPDEDRYLTGVARDAWNRAQGAVSFAPAGDARVLDVLRDLVEATQPLLGTAR